ncbi:hypothetical protein GCK32_000808 [Trichostrongylus colubriformis]|uniref:Uncharacterized protein n=1 Tax=Trichostrongylus colubriformis TaxID=6319 RepID=A0AAN8F7U7_TRICO
MKNDLNRLRIIRKERMRVLKNYPTLDQHMPPGVFQKKLGHTCCLQIFQDGLRTRSAAKYSIHQLRAEGLKPVRFNKALCKLHWTAFSEELSKIAQGQVPW